MEISGKSYHINLRFERMGSQLWNKLSGIGYRILSYLKNLPIRISRLMNHFRKGILVLILQWQESSAKDTLGGGIGEWWMEFMFMFFDILGVPEFYETVMDIIKFNSRPLYKWEIQLAKEIFGNSLDYRRVRIDEYSIAGPKQMKFCYVSFYFINSWGPMQNSIFIHEMTHVWQFEKLGSVYIPRSLQAQQTVMGYNYGGVEALRAGWEKGKSFLSFNLEQQGDIISDYYRIKNGYSPQWGRANLHDLPVYESFVNQIREI